MSEISRRGFLGFAACLPLLPAAFSSVEALSVAEPTLVEAAIPATGGYVTWAQAQALISDLIDEVWESEGPREPFELWGG